MRRSRWAVLLLALAGISLTVVNAPSAHAANRNIVVHFTNNSNSGLTLSSYTLDGGCWTDDVTPPQTVSVGESVVIASESCGVLTGTEFHVSYKLDQGGAALSMHYDNPEAGDDTLSNNAPPGYAFQSTGVIEDHTTIFGCDDKNCHRIVVHVTNNSDSALTLSSQTVDNGCWTAGKAPPQKIAVDAEADIAAEMCGTPSAEFHVSYTLDLDGSTMSMHYARPADGSQVVDNAAPQGYVFQDNGDFGDHTTTFGCNSTTCDGIPDLWKQNGVSIDPGGGNPSQFVNLPAMGVSLDRPNVLVHLDWMADSSGHNQQFSQAAIDTVIRAFNAEPVTYHGATRSGITLIVDNGPNSTITPGGATWGSLSRAQAIPWTQDLLTGSRLSYTLTNFYTLLKSNFVPTGRLPIFHYAVAGAEMSATCGGSNPCAPACYLGDGTSGLTTPDLLGFMVTLGDWTSCVGSQNEQTGTFMHELGHAIGLDHSGGEGNGNSVNYKPNYPSIMNYIFQMVGVPRAGSQVFDYSRDPYPANLNETTLTEAGGVNLGTNSSGSGTGHACVQPGGGLVTYTQQALSPVDWSCDLTTPNGGTGFDANGDGSQGTLNGTAASDWNRIRFKTGGVGAGAGAKDTVTVPSSGVSGPVDEITYNMARLSRVLPLATKLSYTGATTGDYHDPATVSAKLTDPGDPVTPNSPVAGRLVTFQLGSSPGGTCSAVTGAAGTASCVIVSTQIPANYPVTATFDGDPIYQATSAAATFTITKEQTALTLSGPTVVLAGSGGTTLSARLLEDGLVPPSPSGQAVTFTLGSQSCTGTANANGDASCVLPSVSGASLGPKTLSASFAGDAYYLGSSASGQVIVFAFPAAGATFALGDKTVAAATPTTTVTFWGSQWSKANSLSGGSGAAAFKGYAGTVSTLPTTSPPTACAGTWTSGGGNSSQPPGTVPSYMGVIVTTNADKSGDTISGRHVKIVVVKTDPGYGPSPGHEGSGKIVATFCG
jgi:hypothetical protein